MSVSEFSKEGKEIILKIDDVKSLLDTRRLIKNQLDKNRRKLRTKLTEYSFIDEFISVNVTSSSLEKNIKKYFNEIGFENVQHLTYENKETKEEDIRLFYKDILIIIEVSASTGCDAPNSKLGQVLRRLPKRKLQFPTYKVFGSVIINHDVKNKYSSRCENPFKKMKDDAIASGVSLISIKDLVNIFIDIKNKKRTPAELIDLMCTAGVFKDNMDTA